jgi:hypothetical protein
MALHAANKPASRHIDMRMHFCRQHVELGNVSTACTPTPEMVADVMTKQTVRTSLVARVNHQAMSEVGTS